MSKPWIHSISSSRRFRGKPEDYFEIHDFMDQSKGAFPDNRHRVISHNAFFIKNILERVKFSNSCEPIGNSFPYIINSDNIQVSVRDIGEQHILEDFGGQYIPSLQDYLENMEYKDWMSNGKGNPPSHAFFIERKKTTKTILLD